MYAITNQVLSMPEAEERFRGIIDLKADLPENAPGCLYGTELWLPGASESDPVPHHVLFVRADHYKKAELLSKCALPMRQINLMSENLASKESFVILGSDDDAIHIPLWYSKCLGASESQSTVRIVFIGSDWVVDMRHQLTGDDLDGYVMGCQVAMDTTGPNYNAVREVSEERFEEAKGRSSGFLLDGEFVCLCRLGAERP